MLITQHNELMDISVSIRCGAVLFLWNVKNSDIATECLVTHSEPVGITVDQDGLYNDLRPKETLNTFSGSVVRQGPPERSRRLTTNEINPCRSSWPVEGLVQRFPNRSHLVAEMPMAQHQAFWGTPMLC